MNQRTILLYAMCTVLFSACGAAAQAASCPDAIDVQQQLTTPVAGWTTTLDDTPHQLSGITFYDGPPKEEASLVYDQITRAARKETAIWRFAPGSDRQTWMACSYSGTAIVLARALPPKTVSCSVTYNRQQFVAGLPLIESVVCK